MKKRLLAAVLCLTTTVLLAAGCQSGSSGGTDTTSDNTEETQTILGEVTSIEDNTITLAIGEKSEDQDAPPDIPQDGMEEPQNKDTPPQDGGSSGTDDGSASDNSSGTDGVSASGSNSGTDSGSAADNSSGTDDGSASDSSSGTDSGSASDSSVGIDSGSASDSSVGIDNGSASDNSSGTDSGSASDNSAATDGSDTGTAPPDTGDGTPPDGANGRRPGSLTLTGEEKIIEINDSTEILVSSRGETSQGTMDDIVVGSVLTVEINKDNVVSITVSSMERPVGKDGRNKAPSGEGNQDASGSEDQEGSSQDTSTET